MKAYLDIVKNILDNGIKVDTRTGIKAYTIAGAIFCANQYIRQKNVIEDYTYKMVLAKSIVGFSEQLNNGKTI